MYKRQIRDKWKDVKKKRALYDDARTSLINAGESPGEDEEGEKIQINEEPVSYTHLDVYKRQLPAMPIPPEIC